MDDVKQEQLEIINSIFVDYLEIHKLRKTPERFTILEEVYRRGDHFDAESLYFHMKAQNYRVSRATIYNTLELLVKCDLVKSHQFGKNLTLFEKSFGFKQHDHVICESCNKVLEFCDPRLQEIKDMVAKLLEFNIQSHSLNLFGICKECQGKNQGKTLDK